MDILLAEPTDLFIGTEADPRQVVRVRLRGVETRAERTPTGIRIEGEGLRSEAPFVLGPLSVGEEARLEIGVVLDGQADVGRVLPAEVVADDGARTVRHPFEFVVAEPGWTMFMVSHFHYDPVWWNTQAGYTESWGAAIQSRWPFQEPGLALVKAHLEAARRDPDYRFVLAELDYLKPYWDVYPEDRAYLRQLLADGRLELMGGTYNEPNTNLTSAESTIRNAIYGVAYQRDVLGGVPATAWQLDAFGHDPQFPGIMADAGVSSSSWARGPFHEWGPNWVRGGARLPFADAAAGGGPRMQFPTEFDWIAPSGRALLTSFMANHYSAGWWMDAAATLEEAEAEVHRLFIELAGLAATKNVLLPVGTDYTPPNRWLTAIHRDWARRYVWPKFVAALPRQFFAAVREERRRTGRGFAPQTRDMNPIYTGKDVSFIDTKQAQRAAENRLLAAEKFATFAMLLGARFPSEAIDKAWRQLLFGAHHDGITGSESDQVYLDLLGGWREADALAGSVLDGALDHVAARIDTAGRGRPLVVFNPLSWPRTDPVRVALDVPPEAAGGLDVEDESGSRIPYVVEAVERRDDGSIARAALAFVARDVPALGYRTYRLVPGATSLEEAGWHDVDGSAIENETWRLTIDPRRGGGISSLVDKRSGKDLVQPGRAANELLAYREYPNHPLFGEGPWHLTPDGRSSTSLDQPVEVVAEASPVGRRLRIDGPFEACRRRQEILLWDGVERVEFTTRVDGYTGQDRLFRVRFPIVVDGGRPVSEVGNAVVARPFGFPNVDVAEFPFTLDHPAYNWFALGASARVAVAAAGEPAGGVRAGRALGVAEIVTADRPEHDDAVRRLVVALVRQGVTATVSGHQGSRYGLLHVDSNLPDVRLAVGGPSDNLFVADLLASADPLHATELERQLADVGRARLWVPAAAAAGEAPEPMPDLRGVRDLPVLVIAGRDDRTTVEAIDALADDLADGVVVVEQRAAPVGPAENVEDYTVAVLNRGLPGFNVEADGSLYLSLMRSCSGWPSGVWIDPPRRSAPDGSNFQFEHWSHTFEYALAAADGDWRSAGIVQVGHEYNTPLVARPVDAHPGELPGTASLLAVEPASAVATVVKPAGNGMARMAGADARAAEGFVVRLYESSGRSTVARIRSHWQLTAATLTNATEETERPATASAGAVTVPLEPFEIATLAVVPRVSAEPGPGPELAPRSEPAQPVFSGYWLHNKGAAPIGYQPVTVQIRPWFLRGAGPFRLPVVVASERTDAAAAGRVALAVPPGWEASPAERLFRLAPGAHVEFEAAVTPPPDAPAGRYFLAAQISDDAGQLHEDVVTVDLQADGRDEPRADELDGSRPLMLAIERALRSARLASASGDAGGRDGVDDRSAAVPVDPPDGRPVGGELAVELLTGEVRVAAGGRAQLRVSLRNLARSEIRGEAQILGPHETWPFVTPWTQGFAVAPGEDAIVGFDVAPSVDVPAGSYWALVKVMYFGRLFYSESVPLDVSAAPPVVGVGRGRAVAAGHATDERAP